MKYEGALNRRFFRHGGIYRSDVSLLLVNLDWGAASRSGPCQAIGRAGKNTPFPSSAMSSGRLFLDRVGRHHCPSPLRRQPHHKTLDQSTERNYHQTASCGLTDCLSRGVHRRGHGNRDCGSDSEGATEPGGVGRFAAWDDQSQQRGDHEITGRGLPPRAPVHAQAIAESIPDVPADDSRAGSGD